VALLFWAILYACYVWNYTLLEIDGLHMNNLGVRFFRFPILNSLFVHILLTRRRPSSVAAWHVVCCAAVCAKQAEIGIILDHSTSIADPRGGGYDNWYVSVLGFVSKLIEAFPIGPSLTRVGMVGFSSSAWLQFGFNAFNNSRTLLNEVENIDIQGGETNIAQVVLPTISIRRHLCGKFYILERAVQFKQAKR